MTTKLEFSTHWKSSHLGPVHTRMPCRKGAFHAPRAERIAFAICCGRQYIYLIDQKPNKFDTAQMPQSVTPADRPQCLQVLVRLNTCSSDTLRITTKWRKCSAYVGTRLHGTRVPSDLMQHVFQNECTFFAIQCDLQPKISLQELHRHTDCVHVWFWCELALNVECTEQEMKRILPNQTQMAKKM